MKTFKIIDIAGQVLLTIWALMCMNGLDLEDRSFIIFYFGVGGWQVASCIIHRLAWHKQQRNSNRRSYEITLLMVLISFIVIFPLMLIGGPLMAIWYFLNCIYELKFMHYHKEEWEALAIKTN